MYGKCTTQTKLTLPLVMSDDALLKKIQKCQFRDRVIRDASL